MLPMLNIGPLALQAPLLILLIGVWMGISLSEKQAEKAGLKPEDISSLILVLLGVTIIGGRVVYVLQHLDAYLAAPLGMILPNPNTLALLEGSVLGLIAGVVYGQRRQLPLWKTLDVLAPGAALLLAAAAGMNLASGNAYGMPSDLPWAIGLWGAKRHPVQLYALLLELAVLAAVLRMRFPEPGVRFLLGTALLAGVQLFAEGFRAESAVLAGGVRTAQLGALLVLLGALALLRRRL